MNIKTWYRLKHRVGMFIAKWQIRFWSLFHPCRIGWNEHDHDLESHQDSDDYRSWEWVECSRCGATHEEDQSIPEFLECDYDD